MVSDRYEADVVLTCDDKGAIHAPGVVEVLNGRITHVGAEGSEEFAGTVHRMGGLLMPGLVNAHAHTPMTLVRGAGDGLPLQRWLTEAMWPRARCRRAWQSRRLRLRLGRRGRRSHSR